MKDGKITVGECKEIEKAAGNGPRLFLRGPSSESPAPSGQHLGNDGQGEEGRQEPSKLEDTLNNQLPQLFDDAMNLFRSGCAVQQEKPEAPTKFDKPAGGKRHLL